MRSIPQPRARGLFPILGLAALSLLGPDAAWAETADRDGDAPSGAKEPAPTRPRPVSITPT